ncbi:MAG: TonB-dependent receptor plug domain-containing protein [Bacteroidia bacterium]|nr:TonB-dependent receptor plug domain-containing protein [Bacteroidia bacterium]
MNKIFSLIVTICLMQSASGQNTDKKSDKTITITGKVLNMDHKPVEGAVFYIDNIITSFKSKSNGSYKIKVSPSALSLEVRSPEYGSGKTLINNQTTINFTLNGIADNQALKPGDKENEKGIPDSAKKPAKPKAKKMNTYTDIYQMIRGEVSGVVVSGRSIQIQQGHSFFGSSDPLFVVNGIIVNSIDNINPVEVKSITVLKGSSAAIYGVRGANGVISITLINGPEKEK